MLIQNTIKEWKGKLLNDRKYIILTKSSYPEYAKYFCKPVRKRDDYRKNGQETWTRN